MFTHSRSGYFAVSAANPIGNAARYIDTSLRSGLSVTSAELTLKPSPVGSQRSLTANLRTRPRPLLRRLLVSYSARSAHQI